MGKIQLIHTFQYIISFENLLKAWQGFVKGKRSRRDVQKFELNLMSNIISLHHSLIKKNYKHSSYHAFNISDPKPRHIHKASVRDRLVHHAIYRVLYPYFDNKFIFDSYSCRLGKGTHKALNKFRDFGLRVSKNNTKTAWVLKCDIRKFFASTDQEILLNIVREYIPDENINWLITEVVKSFQSTQIGKGLPLGNLTSQLLVNIYMNKFDQFVKHKLKAKYYIRYADDFVILSQDKEWLESMLLKIDIFLLNNLKLQLHSHKTFIKTLGLGVDFLGWVHFPSHRVLRTVTKRRMFRNIETKQGNIETTQSYLGLLKHGNARKLALAVGAISTNNNLQSQ